MHQGESFCLRPVFLVCMCVSGSHIQRALRGFVLTSLTSKTAYTGDTVKTNIIFECIYPFITFRLHRITMCSFSGMYIYINIYVYIILEFPRNLIRNYSFFNIVENDYFHIINTPVLPDGGLLEHKIYLPHCQRERETEGEWCDVC